MNEKAINWDRFKNILALAACFVPTIAIIGALVFVTHLQSQYMGDGYLRYREFWGGNPSEVFSHWLDVVVMSGSVIGLAWMLILRTLVRSHSLASFARLITPLAPLVAGFGALQLDHKYGEGVTGIVCMYLFLPFLLSSYYILHQLVARARWIPWKAAILGILFSGAHIVAQMIYEPSETGAPNAHVLLFLLLSIGIALQWALIKSYKTGVLSRLRVSFGQKSGVKSES